MPARLKTILRVLSEQSWISRYEATDPCLFDELVAAYVARGHAMRAGAPQGALARGDDALLQIKSGRAEGLGAWTKALVAIRRFSEAYGAMTLRKDPRARRRSVRGPRGRIPRGRR